MIGILTAAVLCLAVCVATLFLRFTLQLSVQGRGDPSGQWALAGGAKLGPCSVTSVAGRGAKPLLQLHVFGRRLMKRELGSRPAEEKSEPDEQDELTLRERYARLERWVDPVDLAFFLFSERRRIEVPEMGIELEYSFEDVMLTGQIMSAVHLLNGVLPEPLAVRQNVSWEFVDRAAFQGHGRLACRPGLVLWDVFAFLWKNLRVTRTTAAAVVGS